MRMPPTRPPTIWPTMPAIPPTRPPILLTTPPRSRPLPLLLLLLPVSMLRSFSGAVRVPVALARDLSHAASGVTTTTLHWLPITPVSKAVGTLRRLKWKPPLPSAVVLATTVPLHTSCTAASVWHDQNDKGKHK